MSTNHTGHSADEDHWQEPEDYGDSEYNNGKGLQVTATLVQNFPPLLPGEKRRANAKPPTERIVVYIHENLPIISFVTGILVDSDDGFDRRDLCRGGLDNRGRFIADTPFTMKATVPRNTGFKDITIRGEDDWAAFVEAMERKGQGSVTLTEKVTEMDEDEQGDGSEDSEIDEAGNGNQADEHEQNRRSDTPEENLENTYIAELTEKYRCTDVKCPYHLCWVHPESEDHVELTMLHLRAWANARVAQMDGVDADSPPNGKLFDPRAVVNHTSGDVRAMAKRRAAASASSNGATVIVNMEGLAEALRVGAAAEAPRANANVAGANDQPAERENNPSRWQKISLDEFCERFALSDTVKDKLKNMEVTGPHSLRFMTDEDLKGPGQLLLGEFGDVRDAEQRWVNWNRWDL